MIKKTLQAWATLGGAVLVAVAAAGTAQAQELKIGYVNSERVLREATATRTAPPRVANACIVFLIIRTQSRSGIGIVGFYPWAVCAAACPSSA